MTACELLNCLRLRSDFCSCCKYFFEDSIMVCLDCVHDYGYEMYVLAVDMLETGGNPFI